MNQIPSCAHVKDDGTACGAIPVKGTTFCYFHRRYYNPAALPGDKNYQAPLLESHASIQIALTHLYQAFLAKKIDIKEANFGLQILRLASKTIAAVEKAKKEELREKKAAEAELCSSEWVGKPAPTLGSSAEARASDIPDTGPGSSTDDDEKPVYSEEFLNNPIVKACMAENERLFQEGQAKEEAAQPKRGVWDPYGCMPGGNGRK